MKKIILYTVFLTIPFWGYCQRINEKTALKVAEKVLRKDKPNLKNPVFEKRIPVGLKNDTLYYIFTYPDGGFAVVSADSSAPPVLGHCKKGKYDPAKMPSGLLYLLNKYKYWIYSLRKNKVKQTKHTKEQWAGYLSPESVNSESGYVIPHMLLTKWGQDYNQYCPSGCPAGCTAVAMAQILKYWACRINPTGGISYDGVGYIGATADIGDAYYDWKDMSLDTPDTGNALLIFNAGASCQTHYNHNGSSSTPGRARDGFVDFWGISSSADVKWRISHLSNWNDMIKNELFQGRPVLYSGGSLSSGGHSWVIDGYDNGLFDCNWGWDGRYDGPYSIAGFNTPNGSFNQLESAIFNVYPVQSDGVAEPQLTAQSFTYNPNGYTITIPEAFGATSYQWSCSHGTIQGSGTSATLYSDCNSTVSVRAYNSRCMIYSYYDRELMTIKYGPITGHSTVCTSNSNSTFTLNNRPSGTTVNWINSSNLVYVSGQGTDNYTVQAASSSVSGIGWVKAIVNSNCGNDTIKKDVWVGKPAQSTITGNSEIGCEHNLYFANPGFSNSYNSVQWSVAGPLRIVGPSGGIHCAVQGTNSGMGWVYFTATNTCGSSRAELLVEVNCWGFNVYPNPASSILTIESVQNDPEKAGNTGIKEVSLYDKMMKLLLHKQFMGKSTTLNVSRLKPDVYLLKIKAGDKTFDKKITVSRK